MLYSAFFMQAAVQRMRRRAFMRGGLLAFGVLPRAQAKGGGRYVLNPTERQHASMQLRQMRAEYQSRKTLLQIVSNGDEDRFPNKIAVFTKGLPHKQNGDVELQSYESLLKALNSNDAADFETIARGSGRRFVNPQAGNAYCLEGADPQSFGTPPPPSLDSGAAAADLIELYWQALCRDIPMAEYGKSVLIQRACEELSNLPDYSGPRIDGRVTPETIFRGSAGSLRGPYLSQFLLKSLPYNSGLTVQRNPVPAPGVDYMTSYGEWQQIQAGVPPWRTYIFDEVRRYIRTGRDLAEYVHYDYFVQPFQNAAIMLMDYGPEHVLNTINMNLAESNPYKHSKKQLGFITFGLLNVIDWLGRATSAAMRAAWANKWYVHRRLRPEEMGGRVHNTKANSAPAVVHRSLLESSAVAVTFEKFGSWLLPQAYPEGSPLHPSYPSGHSVVSGACATVLKAFFQDDGLVSDCVLSSADGTELVPYAEGLTIADEIDKLAWNIAMGRDFAGIHYRSDLTAGFALGEQVAVSLIQDLVYELPENFDDIQIRLFDGTYARISKSSA